MVDITIVFMGIISWFINQLIHITGFPHPVPTITYQVLVALINSPDDSSSETMTGEIITEK